MPTAYLSRRRTGTTGLAAILMGVAVFGLAMASPGAQRLAGPELDGVAVRLEPRRSTPAPPTRTPGAAPAPHAWPPPPAKTPRYDSLQLRGLSGPPTGRLALINNQTLRSNETAQVSIADKKVEVQCLAIRDKSVLVRVAGETSPRELKLISQAPIPIAAFPPSSAPAKGRP